VDGSGPLVNAAAAAEAGVVLVGFLVFLSVVVFGFVAAADVADMDGSFLKSAKNSVPSRCFLFSFGCALVVDCEKRCVVLRTLRTVFVVPRFFCCIVAADAIISDGVVNVVVVAVAVVVAVVATNGARLLPGPALVWPRPCPDETNASTKNEPRE